jgi:hypothetical protein
MGFASDIIVYGATEAEATEIGLRVAAQVARNDCGKGCVGVNVAPDCFCEKLKNSNPHFQ